MSNFSINGHNLPPQTQKMSESNPKLEESLQKVENNLNEVKNLKTLNEEEIKKIAEETEVFIDVRHQVKKQLSMPKRFFRYITGRSSKTNALKKLALRVNTLIADNSNIIETREDVGKKLQNFERGLNQLHAQLVHNKKDPPKTVEHLLITQFQKEGPAVGEYDITKTVIDSYIQHVEADFDLLDQIVTPKVQIAFTEKSKVLGEAVNQLNLLKASFGADANETPPIIEKKLILGIIPKEHAKTWISTALKKRLIGPTAPLNASLFQPLWKAIALKLNVPLEGDSDYRIYYRHLMGIQNLKEKIDEIDLLFSDPSKIKDKTLIVLLERHGLKGWENQEALSNKKALGMYIRLITGFDIHPEQVNGSMNLDDYIEVMKRKLNENQELDEFVRDLQEKDQTDEVKKEELYNFLTSNTQYIKEGETLKSPREAELEKEASLLEQYWGTVKQHVITFENRYEKIKDNHHLFIELMNESFKDTVCFDMKSEKLVRHLNEDNSKVSEHLKNKFIQFSNTHTKKEVLNELLNEIKQKFGLDERNGELQITPYQLMMFFSNPENTFGLEVKAINTSEGVLNEEDLIRFIDDLIRENRIKTPDPNEQLWKEVSNGPLEKLKTDYSLMEVHQIFDQILQKMALLPEGGLRDITESEFREALIKGSETEGMPITEFFAVGNHKITVEDVEEQIARMRDDDLTLSPDD